MRLRARAAEPKPDADESLAASVAGRVEEIVAAAEQAAARLQREIERAAQAEATKLRAAAESDAARIRSEAEASAHRMLEDSRQQVDAWTRGRLAEVASLIEELAALADRLAEQAPQRPDARSSEIGPMLSSSSIR